jgi:3'-5' exoribonuclease
MSVDVAPSELVLKKLSEIQHEEVAECFAVLTRKVSGRTKKDEPYWKCYFRDRRVERETPFWFNSRFFPQVPGWPDGTPYRLTVRGRQDARFGMQLELLEIRPIDEARDIPQGYDFTDLVESGLRTPAACWDRIHELVEKSVTDPHIRRLLALLLSEHRAEILRIQAATGMHHAYTGGLIEHIWSMTRIAVFLAEHYEKYYSSLDPPLNRSVVVAATVLHDIGKLRELAYGPVEARYTVPGRLIGHILLGRDMVREAAARIEGFPPETLLLLEHAIVAHHGRQEFGSPVVPQTIEALIVAFVDDLDAKVNQVARSLLSCDGDGDFTERLFGLDNRRIYRGTRFAELTIGADAATRLEPPASRDGPAAG